MTIEQFKNLKVGDKVMIDGKNDVIKSIGDYGVFFEKSQYIHKNNLKKEKVKLITDKPFDFSTLKDNTFCIYDVKTGQAEKIKGIMEELGMTVGNDTTPIYYFGDQDDMGPNIYQHSCKTTFNRMRKNTKDHL